MDGLTYVSTAPKIWLGSDNECKWPKTKGKEKQAIIKELLPEPDWYTLTSIKVLGEYCTYKEALYYEKKNENAYSSSSDVEKGKGKRKKKFSQKYLDRDNSVTPPPCMIHESESESNKSIISSSATSDKNDEDDSYDVANETFVTMPTKIKDVEQVFTPITPATKNVEPAIATNAIIENAEIIFEDNNYRQARDNKIINMLIHIQATLEILQAKILIIEEKLGAITISEEINNDLLPKMPLNSVAEIQELEKSLDIPECQKALFQFLKCTGGVSEKNCISRNLEKMFTNFVAQFCSWTGQKQNFRLNNLKCIGILKSAVRVCFPITTDDHFEKATMQWFQHGRTRFLRECNKEPK